MDSLMKVWEKYEKYLEGLSLSGGRSGGLGLIHVVVLPFFLPIVVAPAMFDAFGWTGPVGFWAKLILSSALLIGLVYSGGRFIWYRHRNRQEPDG
jgi:hypothetical protein